MRRGLRWLLFVAVLCSVSMAEAAWYIGPSSSPPAGSAACSDSAAGTRAAPFCTIGRAKTAMAGSGDKQTYFRGHPTSGQHTTYVVNSSLTWASNENFATDPTDQPKSAFLNPTGITGSGNGASTFRCSGCSNVSIRNMTFDGAPNVAHDGNQGENGNIFIQNFASNVFIESNHFQGSLWFPSADPTLSQTHIKIYHSNSIYIRGNSFVGPNPTGIGTGNNAGEAINWVANESQGTQAWSNLYITDNSFDGCTRWCVELHAQTNQNSTFTHWHLDRNTFSNFAGTATTCQDGINAGAISAAGDNQTGVKFTESTIWGNTINGSLTATNCSWGMEVLWNGATISQNISVGGSAIGLGIANGAVFENNTYTLATSGSNHECNPRQCQFTQDQPNATGSEWVGANTINGATVTGMSSLWSWYGNRSYGAKPATWSPSAPFATGTAPSIPAGLGLTVISSTRIDLSWTASTDADGDLSGYDIYRCSGAACTPIFLVTPAGTGTTFQSTGLTGSTLYRYQVLARDAAGNTSALSTPIQQATTSAADTTPPAAPTGLTVTPTSASRLSLDWAANSEGDLAGYRVYECQGAACTPTVLRADVALLSDYIARGLLGNTLYRYRVTAYDTSNNESALTSSTIVGNTTQTIAGGDPELSLSFEVGAGTAIYDESGHGHNSTAWSGTFSATAHNGSFSGSLNGSQSGRIDRTSGAGPTGLEPAAVTLAAWVRRSGVQGVFTNIVNKTWQNNTAPTYGSYKIAINPDLGAGALGTDVAGCHIGTSGGFTPIASAVGAVPDVTWVHLTCTYDPAGGAPQLKLYVNGVVSGTPATLTAAIVYQTTATGDLYVGQNGNNGEFYTGLLDEVKVYPRVLSLAEIQGLAGVGAPMPPVAPANLRVVSP